MYKKQESIERIVGGEVRAHLLNASNRDAELLKWSEASIWEQSECD